MNYLNSIALVVVTYLTIFVTSYLSGLRDLLRVQIDLLPALMVYCGLSTGWITISVVAVLSGLWFDTLSANPLGVTILPLFLVAFAVQRNRELILREEKYAQFFLGLGASAAAPVLTLLLLWGAGYKPLFGWWSLWQWLVMGVAGGVFTPLFFWLFDRINRAFSYQRLTETSFRPDRQIKRGRG
jgi:cell shape-determining protein MreD